LVTADAGLTVASGQTLTLTGVTVTGLTAASVGAGTFPGATYAFASNGLSIGDGIDGNKTITFDGATDRVVTMATATGLLTLPSGLSATSGTFSGDVLIGTATAATGTPVLDVVGTQGMVSAANTVTNVTDKVGTFAGRHYTNAEKAVLGVQVRSEGGTTNTYYKRIEVRSPVLDGPPSAAELADIDNSLNVVVTPELGGNLVDSVPVQTTLKNNGRIVAIGSAGAVFRPNIPLRVLLVPIMPNDYTEADLTAMKSEVTNGLGNLVARVMKLAEEHLENPVALIAEDAKVERSFLEKVETFRFNEALDLVFEHVAKGDAYMTEQAPYKKIRSESMADKEEARHTVEKLVHNLAKIGAHLAPLMPATAHAILEAVRINKKPNNLFPRL